jgi:hypothetical protein
MPPSPPHCPPPPAAPWRVANYRINQDPQFQFPAAEGHQDNKTDTYYASGILVGQSGHRYAFLTIFAKIDVGRYTNFLNADSYVFALFDLDNGTYATSSSFDLPLDPDQINVGSRRLDVVFSDRSPGRPTARSHMRARPGTTFAYELELHGVDAATGAPMELRLCADALKAPQAVGGPVYNGKIRVMGQDGTYSYFQSLGYTGTLRWGAVQENVTSPTAGCGWLDRQWFPQFVGANAGPFGMKYGHQWLQMAIQHDGAGDPGRAGPWEFSLWRQFDRFHDDRLDPFSGLTATDPWGNTTCHDFLSNPPGVEIEVLSYLRDPGTADPLIRTVLSDHRYLFDVCRIRVPALDLDLLSSPLVAAPGHRLPVYYFSGPTRLQGTMGGVPVEGYGFHERTQILYRPPQLLLVLCDTLRALPVAALGSSPLSAGQLADLAGQALPFLQTAVHYAQARAHLRNAVGPALAPIAAGYRAALEQIVANLIDRITLGHS